MKVPRLLLFAPINEIWKKYLADVPNGLSMAAFYACRPEISKTVRFEECMSFTTHSTSVLIYSIGFCVHCKSGFYLLKVIEALLSIVAKKIPSNDHSPTGISILLSKVHRVKGHLLYEVAPAVRLKNHPFPLKYMMNDFGDTGYLSMFIYKYLNTMIGCLEKNLTPDKWNFEQVSNIYME